jgi:hypothetical protein
MVGTLPGRNAIQSRAMKHLPKHATTFLTAVFTAVFGRQQFTPARKHACVVTTPKPGKDLTLRFSYRPDVTKLLLFTRSALICFMNFTLPSVRIN